MKTYIHALDLSLNGTGVCIFTNDGKLKHKQTIDTEKLGETKLKLKKIGETFIGLIKKYPPSLVVMEKGFTRYNQSTQAIFRVHGVANYLYCEFEQIYYEASTVKKVVSGKGNMSKQGVRDAILLAHPEIEFATFDESDAYAVGYTYFLKQGL